MVRQARHGHVPEPFDPPLILGCRRMSRRRSELRVRCRPEVLRAGRRRFGAGRAGDGGRRRRRHDITRFESAYDGRRWRQYAGAAGERHEHRICRRAEAAHLAFVLACGGFMMHRTQQQSASSAAVGTSLQQNVIGAAATVAIWHASHAQTSHDSRRRIRSMTILSLPWASA